MHTPVVLLPKHPLTHTHRYIQTERVLLLSFVDYGNASTCARSLTHVKANRQVANEKRLFVWYVLFFIYIRCWKYALLQELLISMDQYQWQKEISFWIYICMPCFDQCLCIWSYFPVWIPQFSCTSCQMLLFVSYLPSLKMKWSRNKRPQYVPWFDWLWTKGRHWKLGITCCVYYQPLIEYLRHSLSLCSQTSSLCLPCCALTSHLTRYFTTRKRIIIINDNRNKDEWKWKEKNSQLKRNLAFFKTIRCLSIHFFPWFYYISPSFSMSNVVDLVWKQRVGVGLSY